MSHGHAHGPDGAHETGSHRGRLLIAFSITFTILIAEVIGALVSGSLALLADAGHMLTDAAGLLIALVAAVLSERPATDRRTWGFRRAEVLAATLQAALLLAVGGYVLVNGIIRLFDPPEVHSGAMLVFGAIGLAGNVIAMFVLLSGRSRNLNMRAAFLEVLNDALGSVAVLLAALLIATTGWLQADAVVSILIGLLIVPRTVRLLLETVSVLLEATPRGLDLQAVRTHLLEVPHVRTVHDLHATQIATGLPVLTAHVVVDDECFRDGHVPLLLDQLQACVAEHFDVSVEHSTFQLEPAEHGTHEFSSHS